MPVSATGSNHCASAGERASPAPVSTHALHSLVCCARTGWRLLEDPDEYGHCEAALEKLGGGGGSEVASSFRDHLKAHLEVAAETNRKRLEEEIAARKHKEEEDLAARKHKEEVEKTRAEERRRELDLAERRLELEEARARREEERERMFFQMLSRDRLA